MTQSGMEKGSSVFKVLYTPNRGKRRCSEGTMCVGFDRTVLFDAETRRAVCVVAGTGLRPNPIFALMETAGKGAVWAAGTDLTVGNFAVQIEETMHLHLLPYADCMESVPDDAGEASAAHIANSIDDFASEVPAASVVSVDFVAAATTTVQKCMTSLVPLPQMRGTQRFQDRVRVSMRTTQQLIQELIDAYPQFFT